MKFKNFVLTMIGIGAIYKTGKFAGRIEVITAVNDELRENHGRKMTYTKMVWPERKIEVEIAKVEEEAE